MPGLGRIPAEDPRDLQYLIRAARPEMFAKPLKELPPERTYTRGRILDQGETGCCVDFSLQAKLRGVPIVVANARCPQPFAIYDAAIKLDEFPDNDNDTQRQMGTSVRAGCKVLQGLGLVRDYHWAFSVDDVLQWILSGEGGINLGIDWYQDMFTPTSQGIIRATGRVAGGHAIYAYGASRTQGILYLQNSWGFTWGGWVEPSTHRRLNPGCVKLPLEDLDMLLKGNGEAVAIHEQPYRPQKGT